MGCASSSELGDLERKVDAQLAHVNELHRLDVRGSTKVGLVDGSRKHDVFISHSKKLACSEDRAVWIADVVEGHGLRPFLGISTLVEITESALREEMSASRVCVTVLDPFTFGSVWVFKENLFAANIGLPIVLVYDADRFRWEQLNKWQRLYPWLFARQVVPISKTQRRASLTQLLESVQTACQERTRPPTTPIVSELSTLGRAKVGVGGSRETETLGACETAFNGMLSRLGGAMPSLIVVAFTCTHDATEVARRLHELAPMVPMVGCTSCQGVVLNDTWLTYQKQFAMGVWGVTDDAGVYIVRHIEERPHGLRDRVLSEVSLACKTRDDLPSFALLLGSPDDEEVVISGMQSALGDTVPIIGGSSADNTLKGDWKQIAKVGTSNFLVSGPSVSRNGIVIAIVWASCVVSTTFTSGFQKTEHTGTVTKVDPSNSRTIVEIDGQPANSVYEAWNGGSVTKGIAWKDGLADVVSSSTLMPLGEVQASDFIRVMHPSSVTTSGKITTFAKAANGMTIMMLKGTSETLAKNFSLNAQSLLPKSTPDVSDAKNVVGALVFCCGRLALKMDDLMPVAVEQLSDVVGQNNVMGLCCFGTQGMNVEQQPVHGNLMVGCLLFSDQAKEN